MADYMTDKEEREFIKKWWNDYGKLLMVAVVVGLCVGFGWRYWRQHKITMSEQASATYQAMVTADLRHSYTHAQKLGKQLVDDYVEAFSGNRNVNCSTGMVG